MVQRIAIIGSGPSAVACAYSLLRRKDVEIEMLDVGKDLDSELVEAKQAVTEGADLATLIKKIKKRRGEILAASATVPQKLPFGSRFAYDQIPETSLSYIQCNFVSSLARGGLGNSWGANIGVLSEQEMEDWPIGPTDLAPYYQRLHEFVPISAEKDALDRAEALSLTGEYGFCSSRQAGFVLDTANEHRASLAASGVRVGRAKLAVGKMYATNGVGCVACSNCMHGCPFEAIFNPRQLLEKLVKNSAFNYFDDTFVEGFREVGSKVLLTSKSLATGREILREYDRVFIGCGVIGSSVLVARSLNWCDSELRILDSQKYLFPFLLKKSFRGTMNEKMNTLSQIFIQYETDTQKPVHIQLYGFNDLMTEPLSRVFGARLGNMMAKLLAPIFNRVMIGMLYLPSADSGRLRLKVSKSVTLGYGRVRGEISKDSRVVMKLIFKQLRKCSSKLGGVPIQFLSKSLLPGESQHFGGSLPMRAAPGVYETDLIGRPFSLRRTHVIDTSVFPSIPGSPTTYTVMANAARIADQAISES